MSDSEKYLKGHDLTGDINVPQLDLGGNYISYKQGPASPDNEGIEGWVKMASDGIYFYSEGMWRKTPAYTLHWDDLSEDVRFLPVNKDITLTDDERLRLRDAIAILTATQSQTGLIKGSYRSSYYGSVLIGTDGAATVAPASSTYAGAVLVTDNDTADTAPIVATKQYVDSRITAAGTVPVATTQTIGGIKIGGDIQLVTLEGIATVTRASFDNGSHIPYMGLVRTPPPSFINDISVTTYDDPTPETGLQQYPYVTTVSQVRAISRNTVENYTLDKSKYYADEDHVGFVKPDNVTITINDSAALSVVSATAGRLGAVLLVSGSEPPTEDSSLVFTAYQTGQYVTRYTHANYAPLSLHAKQYRALDPDNNNGFGLVSVQPGSALAFDTNDALYIKGATLQEPGLVTLTTTIPVEEQQNVLTAYRTGLIIGQRILDAAPLPATTTLPGLVALTTDVSPTPVIGLEEYTVPTDAHMRSYVLGKIAEAQRETTDIDTWLRDSSLDKVINGRIDLLADSPEYTTFVHGSIDISRDDDIIPSVQGEFNILALSHFSTRPTLEDDNEPTDVSILNRQEIVELIENSHGELPSWVSYNETTDTVSVFARTVNMENSELTAGTLVSTGLCQASSFIGSTVGSQDDSFSLGTLDNETIITLYLKNDVMRVLNRVTINGDLELADDGDGTAALILYHIAASNDTDDLLLSGNITFDEKSANPTNQFKVYNIGTLLVNDTIHAGKAIILTQGVKASLSQPIPILDNSAYYEITVKGTLHPTSSEPEIVGPATCLSPVIGVMAVTNAVRLINNSYKISRYFKAVRDEETGSIIIMASRPGAERNDDRFEIKFTNVATHLDIVMTYDDLLGGTDSGDPPTDPIVTVVGDVNVTGSIVAGGTISASGIEVSDDFYVQKLVLYDTTDRILFGSDENNFYISSNTVSSGIYNYRYPIIRYNSGAHYLTVKPVLTEFKKFMIAGNNLGVVSLDAIKDALNAVLEQEDQTVTEIWSTSDGNVVFICLQLTGSTGVNPSISADGTYLTEQARIEKILTGGSQPVYNGILYVVPC